MELDFRTKVWYTGTMGEPKASPVITAVRELTAKDAGAPAKRSGAVKALRDSHHLLAKHFALGYGTTEAANLSGYSVTRASILRNDPAFAELVEVYRVQITERQLESLDEYYEGLARIRRKTARMIEEKLDGIDDVSEIPFRDLAMIHSDAADRSGYPKRSSVVVTHDFAAKLDQAIARSNKAKLVNPSGDAPALAPSGPGGGLEDRPSSPKVIENEPLKRRI